MKQKLHSIIAALLIIMIILGTAAYIVVPCVSANASDLSGDLADLQKEREELEKQLNKIENKRDAELEKKEILDKALTGPITPFVPASILQLHPDVTVIYSEN